MIRRTFALPMFGGAIAELWHETKPESLLQSTQERFLLLGLEAIHAATRHVIAYSRDFRTDVGPEVTDSFMPEPQTPDAIWSHVRPKNLSLHDDPDTSETASVALDCSCDWEDGHGLMMVWEGGVTLVKVGGFDGHTSNACAYGDRRLVNVLYKANNPEFTTVRET